ncbi:MAG: S-methyl-5-thioribose-1-phosphate isomerase [Bacillota bacterium]
MRPLIWNGESLLLLDQRALPQEEIYVHCRSAAEVGESIRGMVVRGAPAIGVAAAFAMVLAARVIAFSPDINDGNTFNWPFFLSKLVETGVMLKNTRPTAVNLSWGVERMLKRAEELTGTAPLEALSQLEELACHIYEDDIAINKRIGEYGSTLLPTPCSILTHCNAGALATAGYGTALGVVRSAFKAGKEIQVFADETRPFLQGSRLTAWELQQEGIPVSLIVDGAAGYLLRSRRINCVIVGADRIAANGDVANKIGTYMLAVLAEKHNIPFYVAAPRSTFDFSLSSGEEIEVEERGGEEVTHLKGVAVAPPGIGAINPSFDITPASLVTAIVTEYGIIHHPDRAAIEHFFASKGGNS